MLDSRDPTEEIVQAQHRLLQAERRAVVAQAAASVAHELSQPLTAMLSNGELALWEMEAMTPNPMLASLKSRLEKMLRATDAMTGALKRVQRVVQPLDEVSRPLPLTEVVHNALRLLPASPNPPVFDIQEASLPVIQGDAMSMTQVFVHLLSNCLEALEGRPAGTVRIQGHVKSDTGETLVRIEDDGPGIQPELREQVFKPFFTTRSGSQHLGLGLSIVRQLLKRQGASIELCPLEPTGTAVELLFPAQSPH